MSDWVKHNAWTLLRTLHLSGLASDAQLTDFEGSALVGEIFTVDDDLRGARMRGADLSETQMSGVRLQAADLREAVLVNSILDGADLRDANLGQANLTGASLIGADLRGANLEGVVLNRANLKFARYDSDIARCDSDIGLEPHRQHGTGLPSDEARICVRFGVTPDAVTVDSETCLLVVTAGPSVQIWDLDSRRWLTVLCAATGTVTCARFFRADGVLMLAVGTDGGCVELWNVDSVSRVGEPLVSPTETVSKILTWRHDGEVQLSAFSGPYCRTWNVMSGDEVHTHAFHGRTTVIAAEMLDPAGERALVGFSTGGWVVFDLSDGSTQQELERTWSGVGNIKLAAGLLPSLGWMVTSYLQSSSEFMLFDLKQPRILTDAEYTSRVVRNAANAGISAVWIGSIGESDACIVADELGGVTVHDMRSGLLVPLSGVSSPVSLVSGCRLSSGESVVVAVTDDNVLAAWSLPSLRMIVRSSGVPVLGPRSVAAGSGSSHMLLAAANSSRSIEVRALYGAGYGYSSARLPVISSASQLAVAFDARSHAYIVASCSEGPFDLDIWVVPITTEVSSLFERPELDHAWKLRDSAAKESHESDQLSDYGPMLAMTTRATRALPQRSRMEVLNALAPSLASSRGAWSVDSFTIASLGGDVLYVAEHGYRLVSGIATTDSLVQDGAAYVQHRFSHLVIVRVNESLTVVVCASAAGVVEVREAVSLRLLASYEVSLSLVRVFGAAFIQQAGLLVVAVANESEVSLYALDILPLFRRGQSTRCPLYEAKLLGSSPLPSTPSALFIDDISASVTLSCVDGGMLRFVCYDGGVHLDSREYVVRGASVSVDAKGKLRLRGSGSRDILMSVGLCTLGWLQYEVGSATATSKVDE